MSAQGKEENRQSRGKRSAGKLWGRLSPRAIQQRTWPLEYSRHLDNEKDVNGNWFSREISNMNHVEELMKVFSIAP